MSRYDWVFSHRQGLPLRCGRKHRGEDGTYLRMAEEWWQSITTKSQTIPEAPGVCWISSRFFHQRVLPIQQKACGRLQAAQTAVSLGSRACKLLFAEEELPQRESQLFHTQGKQNRKQKLVTMFVDITLCLTVESCLLSSGGSHSATDKSRVPTHRARRAKLAAGGT